MIVTLEWILAVVLGGWLAISVLGNIPTLGPRLRRQDWIGLIPNWALFARPRMYDVALLQREVLGDGTLTEWRENRVVTPRPWYSFVWHPALGPKRALLAMADQIAGTAAWSRSRAGADATGQGTPGAVGVMLAPHYLMLLDYVSARSHPLATATQFMVVGLEGQAVTGAHDVSAGGLVLFASEFHLVARDAVPPPDDRRGHDRPRIAL